MDYQFSYTITVFTADEDARNFVKWYNSSWLSKNPKMDDFTLIYETDTEMGEVLEVMAHNPFLSVEALLEIFRTETQAPELRIQSGSDSLN